MKKPILITLLCAGLMLVTPFSAVARENTISSNLSEQPDIEGLVAQIRVVIDEILQKYGHIPIIGNLCNVIFNILEWYPGNIVYCILLFILVVPLASLSIIIGWWYRTLFYLVLILISEFDSNCPPSTPFFFDWWFPSFKSIHTMLNVNDNTQSFDGCPCLQE